MTDEILDNPGSGSGDQATATQDTNIINSPPPVVTAPQTWPENWRQEMAGGDEKELKRLERMKAPTDVYKSYRELEKIKSSFVPPPKRPTAESAPEEIKAYRESAGIPEDYKGYDLKFDDGTAIGEDLMPQVEEFLKFSHGKNYTPDIVKDVTKWYLEDVQRAQDKIEHFNDEARVNGKAELMAEWGGEFQGNINAIQSLFTDAPQGTMLSLMNARGQDGLSFANNPDNIRWLVSLAKTINPTASLLPSGATDSASIDTELAKLTAQMHSKDPVEHGKYWKDPKAQERFLKLTQAKQNSR